MSRPGRLSSGKKHSTPKLFWTLRRREKSLALGGIRNPDNPVLSLVTNIIKKVKGKGKAIPLQSWAGPERSRRLRLPDFNIIGT
jgi:hypothetical protein